MIAFRCGHCGKQYSVADELAGRQASCTGCGAALRVPSANHLAPIEVLPPAPSPPMPVAPTARYVTTRQIGEPPTLSDFLTNATADPNVAPAPTAPTIIINVQNEIHNDHQLASMSFADSYSSSRAKAKAKASARSGAHTNGASTLSVILGLTAIGLAVAGYDQGAVVAGMVGMFCAAAGALWGLVTWRGGVMQALVGFALSVAGLGIAAQLGFDRVGFGRVDQNREFH